MTIKTGVYEQVIFKELKRKLGELAETLRSDNRRIDEAEAPKILTNYLSQQIIHGLEILNDKSQKDKQLDEQIELVNKLIGVISEFTKEKFFTDLLVEVPGKELLSISKISPISSILSHNDLIKRPETSLSRSSLFTGAPNEPSMYSELNKEIASSDRVDILISFIRWTGLRLLIEELKNFTNNGGSLRVITTTYMGATQIRAIEELAELKNTEIKINYDTKGTRLHAKAYIFHRATGFTTAYLGSSNLTGVAISTGLECNVKITAGDLPETLAKLRATFESYWMRKDFEKFERCDERQRLRLIQALNIENSQKKSSHFFFDITPYPFQVEILDQLRAEREIRGNYKNLVVAATGTGKTVIAALDYKRFCERSHDSKPRLLFVAHRKEILEQSLNCFRAVFRDPNFGNILVDRYVPDSIDHLFVSIQMINSRHFFEKINHDFYDFIVIDEFHHAAAKSYQNLLRHFSPKILLGLTATPERMDKKDIFVYFDRQIAAEIRLPEAINRGLLVPFQYFGVSDSVNLNTLKWSRKGYYDHKELNDLYVVKDAVNKTRAKHIVSSIVKYVSALDEVRGLGFCVSKEHAAYMAEFFSSQKIPSMCVTADSTDIERETAQTRLVSGEIKFIFVVDLYNEGVDIPPINTILFLRPTESITVFLQQMGRGLRLCENKECLTVLDFIGQANKNYRFEEKFKALLAKTGKTLKQEIDNGFSSMPHGCFIQLERVASNYILENIKQHYNNKKNYIEWMASFAETTGLNLTLENFMTQHHINLRDFYSKEVSFSRYLVEAKLRDNFDESIELTITKALPNIATINSQRHINFLTSILDSSKIHDFTSFSKDDFRMITMFVSLVWTETQEYFPEQTMKNFEEIKSSSVMRQEILDILSYNLKKIDHVGIPLTPDFDAPLDLYASYTRDEALLALDFSKPRTVREGVKWLPDRETDVLFITLNKSENDYSPSTMYKDYSISDELFHWQSQSTTSVDSKTGQRYVNQNSAKTKVLLFVRERKKGPGNLTMPYIFFGPASFDSLEEGSRPMNIIWKLHYPLPIKFLSKTNHLLAS